MGSRNKGNVHTFGSAVKLNYPIPSFYPVLGINLTIESYTIQKQSSYMYHITNTLKISYEFPVNIGFKDPDKSF
jgi:hypothetical protein